MTRRLHRKGYGSLRHLIQQSLATCHEFGPRIEVDGKIKRIGRGLWHDNYWFWIQGRKLSPSRAEQTYVLRLLEQCHDWHAEPEPRDRLIREAETLQVLKTVDFAHPTPEFICFVRNDESEPTGMIETALPGICLDDFRGRTTLALISRAAASVHRLPAERFRHLPDRGDCAQHVKARLEEVDETLFDAFTLALDVREWIETHLPAGDGNCVLHGDLLPQNLLCNWQVLDSEDTLVGMIDWEMALIGDPAYDLAIVSRGRRKVHGVRDGVNVLLSEYANCSGKPIQLSDVRLHELLLVLGWLEEAWRNQENPEAGGHAPDFYEAQLRSLFQRARHENSCESSPSDQATFPQ